jgi:hypothetical protein
MEVKQVCLMIVLASAAVAVADVNVVSSLSPSPRREQSEKQKDEEKGADESAKKVAGALGTETNPVRCEDPKGERLYLSRLRCPDGKRPEFSRIGSFGAGPYGNILDGYRVKCAGRGDATVFMDMYHEGYVEKEAVPGFTIVD